MSGAPPSTVTRFGDLPDAAPARWGDREALVFRGRRMSFREIAAEVDRAARGYLFGICKT